MTESAVGVFRCVALCIDEKLFMLSILKRTGEMEKYIGEVSGEVWAHRSRWFPKSTGNTISMGIFFINIQTMFID